MQEIDWQSMKRWRTSREDDKAVTSVSDEEYEILASFRYALRLFLSFSEEAAREEGLTPQQYHALLSIRGFPGRQELTISELAERLKVRHNSAVGLVNRLVSQGLMVRRPGTDDRRNVYVSLTQRGAESLERLAASHRDQLRRIGPELNVVLDRVTGTGREGRAEDGELQH